MEKTYPDWNYYFLYNSELETKLINRVRRGNKVRKNTVTHLMPFTSPTNKTYLYVSLKGKSILASRIIYEMFHGRIPEGNVISYKDGNSLNIDINNLISVTRSEAAMMRNKPSNKSDMSLDKGIHLTNKGYYRAQVQKNGIRLVEEFLDIQSAVEWLRKTREEMHGEFATH